MSAFVATEAVVEFIGAVKGKSDKEVVFFKESAPFIVEEGAVGLESVLDGFSIGVLLLEGGNFPKKLDAEERWFAALPGEMNFRNVLGFDVLADKAFEDMVRHNRFRVVWEQFFFFEIEAVLALKVTCRTCRFHHDMKGGDGGSCLGDHDYALR